MYPKRTERSHTQADNRVTMEIAIVELESLGAGLATVYHVRVCGWNSDLCSLFCPYCCNFRWLLEVRVVIYALLGIGVPAAYTNMVDSG